MKRALGAVIFITLVSFVAFGCGDNPNPLRADHAVVPPDQLPLNGPGPAGPAFVTTLIAGQTIPVGTLTCWLDGNTLNVAYATDGGWQLAMTHLIVAGELADIPVTAVGNPKVGHFPFSMEHVPPVTAYIYPVDLDAMGLADAGELVLAAHAEVKLTDGTGGIVQEESAWAEGETFPDLWLTKHPEFKDKNNPNAPSERERSWAMYCTLSMAELRGLLLWNKLGSESEVLNSEIGPDGVIVGDLEYLPCTHGNGFKSLPRTGDHNIPDNFVDFPGLNLGSQGCIEFWMHPDWDDYDVGHVVDVIEYGVPEVTRYAIAMGFNDWQRRGGAIAIDYPTSTTRYWAGAYYRPYEIPEWSTTQPFHVAIVWDGSHPVVAERVRVYFNGIDVRTIGGWSDSSGDPVFDSFDPGSVLRLNMRLVSGDWDRHHWESDCQIIDNIKVWSFPKTDFSDRFVE